MLSTRNWGTCRIIYKYDNAAKSAGSTVAVSISVKDGQDVGAEGERQ